MEPSPATDRPPLKVAYVTNYDAADVHAWSGTVHFIFKALQEAGVEIKVLDRLQDCHTLWYRIKKVIYRLVGKNYLRDREPTLLKHHAAQVSHMLKAMDVDVVFSPGTLPIAYLETDKPVVFWTDATFGALVDFYPLFTSLCAETLSAGHEVEKRILKHASLAIFASDWAAEGAVSLYGADPARVKMVPFGANVSGNSYSVADIEALAFKKDLGVCKLLFVGVDWVRKGGDKALAVAQELNRRGVPTELHVVGCDPPAGMPEFVKAHGFVSKRNADGAKYLDDLMKQSHFLIVPSVAECFGLVFAEASSFGLPSLATDVGGIPTVVRNGLNGQTFGLEAPATAYADFVQQTLSSQASYVALARSSFEEYTTRLNWNVAAAEVVRLMQEVCEVKR